MMAARSQSMNMTVKYNAKASMFSEYNNLIKELEQYMPQFKASIKDLQEPSQSFVTDFYTDVLSEFFCDVNNLTEVLYIYYCYYYYYCFHIDSNIVF